MGIAKYQLRPIRAGKVKPQSYAPSSSGYGGLINQAGQQLGVNANIMYKQMMAESGGNPNAYNKGSGAAGLFQFIPGTAKQYGVNTKDAGSSIVGAAKYMKDLLGMFGGDYAKALAGYNWGQGNVMNAVKNYGGNWLAHAPSETQNYLKKILG